MRRCGDGTPNDHNAWNVAAVAHIYKGLHHAVRLAEILVAFVALESAVEACDLVAYMARNARWVAAYAMRVGVQAIVILDG